MPDKLKKQRPLTEVQLVVIHMKMAKKTNDEIAIAVGIHPATVSCKWRAIQKGIAKGAYNNLPTSMNFSGDLFDEPIQQNQ